MKLTKAQKALLQKMKDGMFISNWVHSTVYRLNKKDDDAFPRKPVKTEWVYALAPFFRKEWISGTHTTHYFFRSDAEISDKWLAAEIERQSAQKEEEKAAKEAYEAEQDRIAGEYFNEGSDGPYLVEMKGRWPFGGFIVFNDQRVAEIGAATYSTSDRCFADVLKRDANIPHFEAIKQMLRGANQQFAKAKGESQ